MRFASEAVPIVAPILALSAIGIAWGLWGKSGWMLGWGIFAGVVGLAVLAFFRDPFRHAPPDEKLVVSPADGRILLAETLPDGQQHVAIFLSVFNVHVNRNPVSGTVREVVRVPGTYFHAGSAEASGNARVDVEAETVFGNVRWRQVSGLIARKISCPLRPGDRVRRGEKFGLIYFGSRMDVFLPPQAQLVAKPGQRVLAGESVIAQFSSEGVE